MKKNTETIKFLFIGICALAIARFIPLITPPSVSYALNDLSSQFISKVIYNVFPQEYLKKIKIIAIAIDDSSLRELSTQYPLKRTIYAKLIEILDKEKVNTIGFDIVFSGESPDKEDDEIFSTAIKNAACRVVLAYLYDQRENTPLLPLEQIRQSAYSLGLIDTPSDHDDKMRRLITYSEFKQTPHYSLSVALSAAYLNKKPNDIASSIYVLKDNSFFIKYLFNQKDVLKIQRNDVEKSRTNEFGIKIIRLNEALQNIEKIKKTYGKNLFKNALVLIYPQAEILHDNIETPIGRMPGGFLHLNGVVNIITNQSMKQINGLSIFFLLLSLFVVAYTLKIRNLMEGIWISIGLANLNFCGIVMLELNGIKVDYSIIAIFIFLFFTLGSSYKFLRFELQISKIKDKATLDPLRKLFTLRYFYYRISNETKRPLVFKRLFLVFIYLDKFKNNSEDVPLDKMKEIWQELSTSLISKGKLWSVYSPDELVGCITTTNYGINRLMHLLKNDLESILLKNNIKVNAKVSSVKIRKSYSLKDLLLVLSVEIKKAAKDITLLDDLEPDSFSRSSELESAHEDRILESLDEDIEERNKQLLSLIENLNKEQAKTKEAFFQIITSLVNALEARDRYTQGHSERVSVYALRLAEKIGWVKEEKEKLKKAALLHDLGKIGINDAVLHKKGALTEEEFNIIKQHEIMSVKILEPLKELTEILPWILHHHEKWNGKGYPQGLAGDNIPEGAQIISIADVYDALTTGRDYKPAFPVSEAIAEIVRNKGVQFNPRLIDLFLETILDSQKEQPPTNH